MAKAITQDDLSRELNRLEASLTAAITENTLQIFQYFDKKFKAVDERFEWQDQRIDGLYGLVDNYAKRVEIYHDEMLARDYQFDRMEGWLQQIAQKVDAELEY